MDIDDKTFDAIHESLTKILDDLKHVNDITGTTERVRRMKEEIKFYGWNGICQMYHPDVNCDDPACKELFAMYKYVYETMLNKGEI